MRLDLFQAADVHRAIPGTPSAPAGSAAEASRSDDPESPAVAPPRRIGWRRELLAILACCSLLGQGERCHVDPRYRAPITTLQSYWEALREGNADAAADCFVDGSEGAPMPGALWFLPPTEHLWLEGIRSLPVTNARVLVSYEVHYCPTDSGEERMFRVGSELVRSKGEWRIAQPLGEASLPEWRPVSGPVDI